MKRFWEYLLLLVILFAIVIGVWRYTIMTLQVEVGKNGVYITSMGQTDVYDLEYTDIEE